MNFHPRSSLAAPQGCVGVKEDLESKRAFQTRLEAMKERISGFSQYLQKNEIYEASRKQGLEDLRRLQWARTMELAKEREAYRVARNKRDEKSREDRIAIYNEFVIKRDSKNDDFECARQAYLVQRDHFMQESERLRVLPEEVELGIKPYRPTVPASPITPQKSSPSGG